MYIQAALHICSHVYMLQAAGFADLAHIRVCKCSRVSHVCTDFHFTGNAPTLSANFVLN